MKLVKEVFVQKSVISCNAWTNKKNGRRVYKKYRDSWSLQLLSSFGKADKVPGKRMFIKIISYKSGRQYDKKNFEGGGKPIPDILQDFRWINNDNNTWLESEYEQKKIKKGEIEGTYIGLFEYEELGYVFNFGNDQVRLNTIEQLFDFCGGFNNITIVKLDDKQWDESEITLDRANLK